LDINDWRGIGTVLCMIAFFAVVVWAYSPSRKARFDAAAQLPFMDDQPTRVRADDE
jgi:cytochrome c oxidase cbb3-type subunit IV